ncbi:6-phosphogluconolactonase, partial [Citrobacter braakii]|uniref:6-phosphogluconolactonase n=1 Tax=Citrobacter braakii TaxID=57706 RepID=UPI003F51E432
RRSFFFNPIRTQYQTLVILLLGFPDSDASARHLSARLTEIIRNDPQAVLGLATGGTMEPIYARFVQDALESRLDVSQVSSFNLDEYVGL